MPKYLSLGSILQNGMRRRSPFNSSYSIRQSSSVKVAKDKEDGQMAEAKPFEQIPHFKMWPIIGSSWIYMPLIGFYKMNRQHLANRHKKIVFGDIFREKYGSTNFVLSFRAEDQEVMFRNEGKYPFRCEFSTFKAYRDSRKEWYSTPGFMVLQGEEWHNLRMKTQKHFLNLKKVESYISPIQEVAIDFRKKIFAIRDQNNEVPDFLEELYKWSLESIAYLGLDTRLGCLERNLPADSDAMKMIQSVQTQFEVMPKLEGFTGSLQLWKFLPTPTWRKFTRASDVFTEVAFKFINRAVDSLKHRKETDELTVLQSMLMTPGLNRSDALVTVADLLMAGIDTTAHSTGFLLYHLARNPEKQEILFNEIKRLVQKDEKITVESFREFKYLRACMKESRRLLPVLMGNARVLSKDVILSGYKVPAGTVVGVIFQEVGRDERYFYNPQEFLPERWLDKENKPHPFATPHFGLGVRSCLGKRIAELEVICLITEIIRNFKVEYKFEDIDMLTRIINKPDKPLRYNFIDRKE